MAVRKLAGKNVVRVYLLDNSMKTFLVEDDATAGDVCTLVGTEIGVPMESIDCFSLHECKDGVTIEAPLTDSDSVVGVMDKWGKTDAKFVFMAKLFLATHVNTAGPKLTYMLYIQAVYNVICGLYPIDSEDAIALAALQVLQKFGKHRPDIHKLGFLTAQLIAHIPAALLPAKPPATWEAEIFAKHASLTLPKEQAAREYLRHLADRDFYGCAFYPVSQKFSKHFPRRLLLGVSHNGVFLFEGTTKEKLHHYAMSQIKRWGFSPRKNFYIDAVGEGELATSSAKANTFIFRTQQGANISALLTDYAMALLKEKEFRSGEESKGEMSEADKEMAVVRMQAMFRGYRLRRDLEYDYAAVRVQAVYRGYKERCAFDKMIANMEAELEAAEAAEAAAAHSGGDPSALKAAVKLQAAWRGYQDRAQLVALEEELSVQLIQAQMRGALVRSAAK